MDFTLEETQQAVARLAAEVLGQGRPPAPHADPAVPRGAGPGGTLSSLGIPRTPLGQDPPAAPGDVNEDGYDWALWKELGQAGLLSLALPAELGGDGLGVMDVAVLLTEVGRRAASVPALATLVLGVLPVVRWGDRDLQQVLLAGVAAGDAVLTAAVREVSDVMPQVPATTARLADRSGTVSGVKVGVPYAAAADWILVPASLASGVRRVVIVEKSASGVSLRRTPSASGEPEYTLRLDEAPVAHVLGAHAGGRVLTDLHQLALAGACCLADGALAAALALTTAHVASRQQFGRPLAAFQAVAQQIADVYIASRTLHLATLSACWRLQTGLEAADDLDVAAYWLAEQAPAALMTCHHLHGGIGMDVSYPLHRYSSLVRDLVRFVGGAEYRLDRLGATAGAGAAS
ncbi:MAG TPA: acyl-CoA dehydrogenase family protein [Streptosporangiaceae bacterium]|nr:acyl-CoA dehydrogenase family protein [Streptosporangiaceae bacterium]